jgi:hypothetical protein
MAATDPHAPRHPRDASGAGTTTCELRSTNESKLNSTTLSAAAQSSSLSGAGRHTVHQLLPCGKLAWSRGRDTLQRAQTFVALSIGVREVSGAVCFVLTRQRGRLPVLVLVGFMIRDEFRV